MKPNFALTLSFEGIGLLHRAFPGWHVVGEISLDTPDLAADLAGLRDKALALDPSGLRTKLVIPNDQIRYIQFDTFGLEADEIADAARRALEGATPYAVDDLAFDWSISAGQVHVAAVARETLSEAEAFAKEHAFNPLSFVAIPEGREFVGEPWFGDTATSKDLLPEGGYVERDTVAIRVIGTAPTPAPESAPDPVSQPPAADEKESETAPKANTIPSDAEPAPVEDALPSADANETSTSPAEDTGATEDTPVLADIPETTAVTDTPSPADTADEQDGDTEIVEDPAPSLEDTPPPSPDPAPVAFSSIRARRDDVPAKTPSLSGATRSTATAPETATPPTRQEPPLTTTTPSGPKTPPPVTGTPQDAISEDVAARMGASLRPTQADRLAIEDDGFGMDDVPNLPASTAQDETSWSETAAFDTPTPAEPDAADFAETLAAEPAAAYAAEPNTPSQADRAPSFFSRRQNMLKRARPVSRKQLDPATAHEQEKQRMTVFGAREPARVGGKPRFLGVILTAVLLIFLVGVAAWASIFLDDGLSSVLRTKDTNAPTEQIAATPDVDADLSQAAPENEDTGTSEADTVLASLPDVTTDTDAPRAALPDPNPAELSPDEARARYAVTGIWQRAPQTPVAPGILTLDDFYLTSIDPKVLEQDAVALPNVLTLLNDTRPGTPSDPPAADTTFALDARGYVRATPEGALTPEGVRVFTGKPPLVPSARPDPPEQDTSQDTDAATDPEVQRLAAFRPKPRPTDLAEQNQRSNLGGRTRDELASLRPKLRPPSAQQLAEQAAAASTAAVLTPDAQAVENAVAAAVQTPDPFAGATAQAVAVSVKPKTRPGNFERIVRRTQQRNQQRSQDQETVQTAAAVPRNQRVTPSAPTATTVARAATEKNALRLRRVNLIGVYGTPSNRRALVRLANGRYKKVKIGDRLDGGRVAAIGDSELRYVKSGRSVTLTMPRG